MSDALDPSAILSTVVAVLPKDKKTLSTPQDGIAILLHSVMTILGFRLVGLDDSSSDVQHEKNVLPVVWAKNSPDSFAFRYRHDQSSLVFLLKVVKLSKRLVIHGIALEDDKTTTLDIPIADFTSESSFPYDAASENVSPLVHAFISSARVKDLVGQYKLQVLQKLVPGLRKEGYEDGPSSAVPARQPSATFQPSVQPEAARPAPAPFSPEPDLSRPFTLPQPGGSRSPFEIGRSDLEPLGGNIPNPFAPPSLFPGLGGGNSGDGMYAGPSHPMFGDRMNPMRGGGVGPGGQGPWGGDGFLPPMGAPPGARFDPVGPFGPGRGGSPAFPGSGSPLGGAPRRGFGPGGGGGAAGPDNDEFMPPGYSDMYS